MHRSLLAYLAVAGVAASLVLYGVRSPAPFAAATSPTPGPATSSPFLVYFTTTSDSNVIAGQTYARAVASQPPAGASVSYRWDLGDGTVASGASVRHTYADPGAYLISVTATLSTGPSATIQSIVNVVPPPAPAVQVLAPGQTVQTGFRSSGCPPSVFDVRSGSYIPSSCGCCVTGPSTLVNDGEVLVRFTYDFATQTVLFAVPSGWSVVTPDISGCAPLAAATTNAVSCPAPPQGGPPSRAFHVDAVVAGTYPSSVTYPAGWNLIAGVTLSADAGRVFALGPDGTYISYLARVVGGPEGYWAYFPQAVTVPLAPNGPQGAGYHLSPGLWTQIGNPGQVAVTVEGADVVLVYDPSNGTYAATDMLQPGQGAWAYADAGAAVILTPSAPEAVFSATRTAHRWIPSFG